MNKLYYGDCLTMLRAIRSLQVCLMRSQTGREAIQIMHESC